MSVNPRLQNTQQTYHLHYDQVGTLRVVTNAHGQNIKEITYDTFGHIRKDTNPSFNIPFGFAGGLYDVDTKLTRFGYRDYDAYTGKWTAKDPIGFDGGDSNLYGYVLGDPVDFVDPMGLKRKTDILDTLFGWLDILEAIKGNTCEEKQENMHQYCIENASGWFGLALYYCTRAEAIIYQECTSSCKNKNYHE